MKYLSVCSGIEAATVAWHPLGWTPFAFSEIDPFPGAVLAHHYGATPNLGDMTKFEEWPDAAINVLVGGTPCQSFSVAGFRKGLADARGNLALVYLAIADRYRPEWVVWENVPGVLSSNGGRDFGAFLGGLVECGYGFAYRVLDAQFVRVDGFGRAVAQRRRRVFVVGNSRHWTRAAAVLFERESLSWDHPPRRQAGQGFTRDVVPSLVGGGCGVERVGETRGQDPVVAFQHPVDVSPPLRAGGNETGGHRPHGTDVDTCDSLIPSTGDVSHCLNAGGMGRQDYETETVIAHALRGDGFDASEDGTGRGTPLVPVAAFTQNSRDELRMINGDGGVIGALAADHGAKQQNYITHPFTLAMRGRGDSHQLEARQDGAANAVLTPGGGRGGIGVGAVADRWAVRRLMPVECERLQGFEDGYTDIVWRGRPAADGLRYKALGNSMAVNVMRWIGRRIERVQAMTESGDGSRS